MESKTRKWGEGGVVAQTDVHTTDGTRGGNESKGWEKHGASRDTGDGRKQFMGSNSLVGSGDLVQVEKQPTTSDPGRQPRMTDVTITTRKNGWFFRIRAKTKAGRTRGIKNEKGQGQGVQGELQEKPKSCNKNKTTSHKPTEKKKLEKKTNAPEKAFLVNRALGESPTFGVWGTQ